MRFIVVDGIDGAGKSTVAEWMCQHYNSQGESVHVQHHPSRRLSGKLSARFLQGEGRLMYILSSIFYMIDVLISVSLLPLWERRYDNVIFVRYILSTAYLPGHLSQTIYDIFIRVFPIPERLLLVDVEPESALQRISKRQHEEEMFENLSSLTTVREKALNLADAWMILDNNGCWNESLKQLGSILDTWDEHYHFSGSR
ncbi:MAG: deoxynucleoside kinase [Euryarchaeota archaeon]|nr:deoxynucleoside kinase [Euryarchaeota archaeon]